MLKQCDLINTLKSAHIQYHFIKDFNISLPANLA